nr:peptidylprolyl isomerase [Clostridia bacterium]
MSKKIVKIISAALFVCLLALCVSSCGYKYGGSVDENVVMTVGGFEVTVDEYNYFFLNAKHDLDQGLESYWNEHPGAMDELRETVVEMLRIRYAVDSLAKECGVELDDADHDAIVHESEIVAEYYGGDDAFKAVLAETNMTGDLYYDLSAQSLLDEKLRLHYISEANGYIKADDETLMADIEANFARAKQVLIANDVNDDILANKALAEDIADRAAKGEDFDALIKQYSEDTAQNAEHGRYITYGMMLEPFEEAVFAMDEGEVSGVVESTVGYHVIKRLPMEQDYIDTYFEELRDLYMNRCYNEKLTEVGASLEVVFTEAYDGLISGTAK